MDVWALLMDRQLLSALARDMRDDVVEMSSMKATALFGDKEAACVDDSDLVAGRLDAMLAEDTPLWQLQYALLVTLYVSDRALEWFENVCMKKQARYFVHGTDTGVSCFRERFETHVTGKFRSKEKKGQRKVVAVEACTPHVAVVRELLLAHQIVSWP